MSLPCESVPPLDDLLGEMTAAWERGERPLAEDFLARHPRLEDRPEAVADLIYEEICLREQYGEYVRPAALLARFPRWRAQLEVLLDCQRLFESEAPARFPTAGESYGEFRLLTELGRGGGGVVFLAVQPLLADRPVVLKLTPRTGCEHLRLARLQHTHIVPLYSALDDPDRRMRALCMPYFGGTSLSRILTILEPCPPRRRTGKDLLDALDKLQASSPLPDPVGERARAIRGSARQLLVRASYVQAICWIGNCLANALHYAHEHGLVHLDLKPANVLLTAEGQPMLLDFHLAREPVPPGSTMVEGLGGTPDFMSPEQRQAVAAVCGGRSVPAAVDARSDIYSLGLLLFKALGDSLPPASGPARALRRANPEVSVGLADILGRCLATAPRDRYPDAHALADDLQRHLKDLSLRGVPNRNLPERWRKWRRRRPAAFPLALMATVVVVGTLVGVHNHFQQQLGQSRAALAEGKARLEEGRCAEAVDALHRGLRLVRTIPFHADLEQTLREHLDRAEVVEAAEKRTRVAAELHRLAEQTRLLMGNNAVPQSKRRSLEATCRSLWERRKEILERLSENATGPTASVREDLLDLALFWSDLGVSLASDREKNAARRQALQILDEAEELFGPSPVLFHRREVHAAGAGLVETAREAARRRSAMAPRTAWEHLALGRSYLEAGAARLAVPHFAWALALAPDNLWPNFYKGVCFCKIGEFNDAVVAFSVCVGLAPAAAPCYYNRACAYAGCNQPERALRDYDRALQLDPTLAVAALNRGRLHFQQKRFPEALDDLEKALHGGVDRAVASYDIALVKLALGERAAAFASLETVLAHDPTHAEARKLQARLKRNP